MKEFFRFKKGNKEKVDAQVLNFSTQLSFHTMILEIQLFQKCEMIKRYGVNYKSPIIMMIERIFSNKQCKKFI